ncbi:MAG TPA: hypothetical protein VNH11_33860 [Pirellulales bacterium]|nr:hypothetical protein [Pirellulales bacterium]
MEDKQTVPRVRLEVFDALARLKDAKALPVLERIASGEAAIPAPAWLGPEGWANNARAALAKIREQ